MDARLDQHIEFKMLESLEGKLAAFFEVSPNLPPFEGHFPGRPILPAVAIIDISLMLLAETGIEVSHAKLQLKRSKFAAIVTPNQKVLIQAESEDKISWRITWSDQSTSSKLAQIHLLL